MSAAAVLVDSVESRDASIRAAAERGDAAAQAAWGQLLLDSGDERAAFGWFNLGAAAGNAVALNMVGRCYDLGWGTPVDKVRAAECFRVAGALGLPEAMYNRATALALGDGVAEDRPAALALFERAAAAGFAKAWNHVGSFAEDGWVNARDMEKAARCYARAADGGDFRGMFNHARMLAAAGDDAAALDWLERCGETATPAFIGKAQRWLAAGAPGRFSAEGPAAVARRQRC